MHRLSAFRATDGDGVDIGTVKFDVFRAVVAHFTKFGNRANRVLMTTFTFPDIKWCAPVTVTAQPPILNVFKPVAEASLADTFRHPVDGIVVADEIITDIGHADKPRITRIVQKRRMATPAVRITVFEYRRGIEKSAFTQIL